MVFCPNSAPLSLTPNHLNLVAPGHAVLVLDGVELVDEVLDVDDVLVDEVEVDVLTEDVEEVFVEELVLVEEVVLTLLVVLVVLEAVPGKHWE